MDVKDRLKLQKNYSHLIEVHYSCISPHLISTFVLDMEMHAEIQSKPTERKKMENLLSILPTRGAGALKELITALRPNYFWLVKLLEEDNNNTANAIGDVNEQNNNRQQRDDLSISKYMFEIEKILGKSSKVNSRWTLLANAMGLNGAFISDIKREMTYSGGMEYAIHTLLDSWMEKMGKKATLGELVCQLTRLEMTKSADEIEELWVNSLNTKAIQQAAVSY